MQPDQNQPTQVIQTPVLNNTEAQPSFWIKIAMLSVMALYIAILSAVMLESAWLLLVGAAIMPAVYVGWKKVRGLLLPYAVATGVAMFINALYYQAHSKQYAGAFEYVRIIKDVSAVEVFGGATALTLVLALIVFCTTSYGAKITKAIANILWRFVAVFLLLFAGNLHHAILDTAKYHADTAEYGKALVAYNAQTLDPRLPYYGSQLLTTHTFRDAYPKDQAVTHRSYELYYTSSVSRVPDATINIALGTIPAMCDNTNTPVVKIDDFARPISCNVVVTSPQGQKVYGYRDLRGMKFLGYEPKQLTSAQIKQYVPPSKFYIQKGDAIVTLQSGVPTDYRNIPLTWQAVSALADGLHEEPEAREAFITKYIKSPKPFGPPNAPASRYEALVITMVIAFYLGLFLWAIERIFTKAKRDYWMAYVPFVNLWVLTKIAGRSGGWSLFAYINANPLSSVGVNILFSYFFLAPILLPAMILLTVFRFVFLVLLSTSMSKRFGKSGWFSWLLAIPPFPGYLILGFGKSEYKPVEETIATEIPTSVN